MATPANLLSDISFTVIFILTVFGTDVSPLRLFYFEFGSEF